jgi:hypothetical protein
MTGWGQEPAVKDVEIAAIPTSLCTGLHRLPDRSTVNRQKLVSAAPAYHFATLYVDSREVSAK